MKALLAILVLTASLSAMAMEGMNSTQAAAMTLASPFLATVYSVGGFDEKIIASGVQEYNQSGDLSLELQEVINRVQSQDQSLSVEDVIDLLQNELTK